MKGKKGISEEISLGKDSPIVQAGTQIVILFRVFRGQKNPDA